MKPTKIEKREFFDVTESLLDLLHEKARDLESPMTDIAIWGINGTVRFMLESMFMDYLACGKTANDLEIDKEVNFQALTTSFLRSLDLEFTAGIKQLRKATK